MAKKHQGKAQSSWAHLLVREGLAHVQRISVCLFTRPLELDAAINGDMRDLIVQDEVRDGEKPSRLDHHVAMDHPLVDRGHLAEAFSECVDD